MTDSPEYRRRLRVTVTVSVPFSAMAPLPLRASFTSVTSLSRIVNAALPSSLLTVYLSPSCRVTVTGPFGSSVLSPAVATLKVTVF